MLKIFANLGREIKLVLYHIKLELENGALLPHICHTYLGDDPFIQFVAANKDNRLCKLI